MNGCCMTNAECGGHDLNCYFYWPCGCRKERDKPTGPAKTHTHTFKYAEQPAPEYCDAILKVWDAYDYDDVDTRCGRKLPCIRHGKGLR